MTPKPAPILLTWKMPDGFYVTSYRSLGAQKTSAYDWEKKNQLPSGYARATDFEPSRMHILTDESPSREQNGWSCDGQWKWETAPYRAKERIVKQLITNHLKKTKEKTKIGSSWILEGPHDIRGSEGDFSQFWLCADFTYCEMDGQDGIVISISRKVQAAQSLWEEHQNGFFVFNDNTRHLRVKVAVADDPTLRDSKEFLELTDMNLNAKAWKESDVSVAEYWGQRGHPYTEDEANEIPVILVKSWGVPSRHPADKAYRVMSMDQWSPEIYKALQKYLKLKPSEYLSHVKMAMGWLRGWRMQDWVSKKVVSLGSGMSFSWDTKSRVDWIDTRKLLNLPHNGQLLNDKWRLNHHLRSFESLQGRPPPSVDAYFITPPGCEGLTGELRRHSEEIFKCVPGWSDRIQYKEPIIIPNHSLVAAERAINQFIQSAQSTGRSIVVFSALPPKTGKEGVNLYKCLKYELTSAKMVHQNFSAISSTQLKKTADWATGQVNVLQMLLKHGILPVPYTCSVGDVDLISGIDVGRVKANRSVAAVAVSISKSGILWGTTPRAEPQTGETISESALRRTFKEMISKYHHYEGMDPSRILVLRDGNTPPKEMRALEKIIAEYQTELRVDICWITIRKTGCPRLLLFDGKDVLDKLPTKGYWMRWSDESAWIWTTGEPNLAPGRPGIPQGINFTIKSNFELNPLSIEDAAKLLTCQAHASQSQPFNSTRLPFVMHLADKQAKAMANEEIPLDPDSNRFSAI